MSAGNTLGKQLGSSPKLLYLSTLMVYIPNLRFIIVPSNDSLFNDPSVTAEKITTSPISNTFKTNSRFPSFVLKVSKELMRVFLPLDFMMRRVKGEFEEWFSKKIKVRCIT